MITIKVDVKIVIISLVIAILMYPNTLSFLFSIGEDIYIEKKLISHNIHVSSTPLDTDTTKIIFMFDDGWQSVYSEAYPIMKQYDYKGSIAIIPSLVGEYQYMSYKELTKLYLQGWDLLNHSYSHDEGMYNNSTELLLDFNKAKQWMVEKHIGRHSDILVMPYGLITPQLIEEFKTAGYSNIRSTENSIVLNNNLHYYQPIHIYSLLEDVSASEVKDFLTQTFYKNETVILLLHKIDDTADGFGMTYSKDKLKEIFVFIDEHKDKLKVVTYSELFY